MTAPNARTASATVTLSAILSFVPNRATTNSLEPGGAKSMTAVPTAISGDGAPPADSAEMSSPAARAAPAAMTPDRAAAQRGGTAAADGAAGVDAGIAVGGRGSGRVVSLISRLFVAGGPADHGLGGPERARGCGHPPAGR